MRRKEEMIGKNWINEYLFSCCQEAKKYVKSPNEGEKDPGVN